MPVLPVVSSFHILYWHCVLLISFLTGFFCVEILIQISSINMPSSLPTYLLVCFPSFVPIFLPSFRVRTVGQKVSRRPLTTAEDWVRSQAIPSEICGDCNGSGTELSPNILRFPPSLSFHKCPRFKLTHLSRCCMLLAVHCVVTKNAFNYILTEWLKRQGENAAALCLHDISTGSTVVCAVYALLLYIKTS